jgi:dethiobiotin synthetase
MIKTPQPPAASLFVTGTDTSVGKTVIASALLRKFASQGWATAGWKPVASGCELTSEGLRNEDALLLNESAGVRLPYELLNPYAFEPAIAPHVAAAEAHVEIDLERLRTTFAQIGERARLVIIEGAGGWRVPLSSRIFLSDLPETLQSRVVLVVGLRLGCINHALLTAEAIARSGLALAGWIGNRIDENFARAAENIATLARRLPAPCLGIVPTLRADARFADEFLCIDHLIARFEDCKPLFD